jgi:hypothetical protein
MKAAVLFFFLGNFTLCVHAQKECASHEYQQQSISKTNADAIERFIARASAESRETGSLIRIPVVIHNLYHYQNEKVSEQQIQKQLDILNACYRRRNADTVNTPSVFKPFAADVEIEFALARSDVRRAATTGIIRKYTPVIAWGADDKMKFSSEMGDDAWDSRYYLNIWVCNLDRFAGYASFPGADAAVDGIVLDIEALAGSSNNSYSAGKTAVHEVGHWLGLKHLWGDELCGDDKVDDTPRQASYTPGCPKTIRITCGNGPYGDMYMNYMDFTSDACVNMFTLGQKTRMRSLFSANGPRALLLESKGLNSPLILSSQLEEPDPTWLHSRLYPNPANAEITLDLSYDERWIGQTIRIFDITGQPVMNLKINSKASKLDISSLKPGIYFLQAEKPGEKMMLRFIKM